MTARAAATPGLAPVSPPRREIPRQDDDYTAAAARRRLAFLTETTGAAPEHLGRYSFDPAVLDGNIENFIGVAQVPVGIAGPLLVDGEHVPSARAPGPVTAIFGTLYLYVVRPGRPIMRHARCASSGRCQALEVDHGRSRAVAQTAPPKLCL